MKKIKKQNLKGFSLTDLLVAILILGVLMSIILPNFTGTVTKAKETEAQLQLRHVFTLQKYYFNLNSKYSSSLDDIDYVQEKLSSEGGGANYKIEIVESSPSTFKARATSVVDFDQDGTFNVWEIDQNQQLKRVVKD